MKRRICALLLALSLVGSYCPTTVFATGYPVFDVSNWLSAIDRLYQMYDMVNNTITQIENQYKQIQHSLEVAKSIDWDNIRFDGDFDIRNDIKDANRRVNKLLTQARNIKQAMTTPSINCGNVKYSIADLCGATSSDMWESRKNMLTAIQDYKYYMTNTMKSAVNDVVEGLNDEQQKAIWRKYGISPQNYVFVQQAHTSVLNGAANIMANVAEESHNARLEERLLRTSAIIKAATETKDSEGNVTQASMLEAIMYLFQNLDEGIGELQQTMFETSSVAASAAIAEDAQKQAEANETAEQAEIQSNLNSTVSSRFMKSN
ncbi:MAG: hypothetical protein IJ530_01075 [Treponema sp.]|uniref:hypothetical protein n=1 Tax=Treponema sp. TaxID=166 RepID=UPI0025E2E266|nr:hypothetical protein [Treponema sp.]MBQ8678337.1 hypothetical protein [Treponema sp.]